MPGNAETDSAFGGQPGAEASAAPTQNDMVQGELTPIDEILHRKRRRDEDEPPAYYDISMLQPPVWKPEVSGYFFLGGLSSGAFLLARIAARMGRGQFASTARHGAYLAAAGALPCAPLLILDLGDPKRFHHMLRVFKPRSPMNFGTWAMTTYSACAVFAAYREWLKTQLRGQNLTALERGGLEIAGILGDIVGIPAAILLGGYTGVLLSTTSTPVWCKNMWLGPLFASGAIGTGCAAIRLSRQIAELRSVQSDETADKTLKAVASGSHICEAVMAVGYVAAAGKLAHPLLDGPQKGLFVGGGMVAGILLPEILDHAPVPKKAKPWLTLIGAVATLIGGFCLRHAFIEAGKTSALDPEAARQNSKQPG